MKWKIHYADGLTFCDQQGTPFDAPAYGVIAIAQEHQEVGREVNCKEHLYWWHPGHGRWYGGDHLGAWDYLRTPGPQKIICGRIVSNDAFRFIMDNVLSDSYLPAKSARLPGEKH